MPATRSDRQSLVTTLGECDPVAGRQGVCIWFTASIGPDTTAVAGLLAQRLLEYGRATTTLDGEVIRTHLSQGLDFTREDRDTSVRRIGFVAAEIVRHGGTVICSAISPDRSIREDIRTRVGTDRFVEVRFDARRDISDIGVRGDRSESPSSLILADVCRSPATNASAVVEHLARAGFIHQASLPRWDTRLDAPVPGKAASDPIVAHSLCRWADTVVKSVTSPSDLRTLNEWGRFVGVSVGGLRNWCRSANLPARRSLLFARLLRAVIRQRGTEMTPDVLLNVVDRRTLAKLLALAGGPAGQLPHTLEDYLTRQQLIRKPGALATIRLALGHGAPERIPDAMTFELHSTM